jgi:hypothetical protein
VDFLSTGSPYGLSDWHPSTENLWRLDVAMREYLAFAFYAVKGW